uniref:DNA-directed RNA polymerase subunit beta'' n=1 Tax=Lithodesmium undulatum TaxID=59812 RepID=A0A023HC19_LITUN|nr:RNA polymerase b''-subunit [Lithodesmium undulatum]AGH28998.1 RNA polymerase b''-subunit [Lithodesmium undulatum]
MKNYIYQNTLISKKQLKQLLAWSFTKYDSMQACSLADELKYLGFKYASQAGISISIEDLKVPFIKDLMLQKANQEILNAEKICLKGKITDVERFQKIIDTWNLTSESLKDEVVSYFKTYDPLNSVYIMAFSGARGNLSQVRQLVGMRGLMSDPSGEIMKLPIKKNFREGLTITDYLMSGYGARKGIVDTALKTANSGYLTRRLIDVAQDIIIREKDCLTTHCFLLFNLKNKTQIIKSVYDQIVGRLLSKPIYDPKTKKLIANIDTQLTPNLIRIFKEKNIDSFYIRSPLTCSLYRSICQKCYGWDLANENLVEIGEAIGILAGQSIGEPGTQLTMRTFHTGGIFTSEASQQIVSPINGVIKFGKILKMITLRTNRGEDVLLTKNSGSLIIISEEKRNEFIEIELLRNTILFIKNNQYIKKDAIIGELSNNEKQVRTEIKPVYSHNSGEIFLPRLKNKNNFINRNKLLWILSGQVYQAPMNSFLNFYTDHKINKNSYIFRTKIVNYYAGFIKSINNKKNLFQRDIQIINNSYSLANAEIQQLSSSINNKHYLLTSENLSYIVNLTTKNSKTFLITKKNNYFGTVFSNKFKTLTGGIGYYDQKFNEKTEKFKQIISYYLPYQYTLDQCLSLKSKTFITSSQNEKNKVCYTYPIKINPLKLRPTAKKKIYHRSLIWMSEETYQLNCDKSILLAEHGNFISKNFEIVPNILSKTGGIIHVSHTNNIISEILIKSGLVYQGKGFENFDKKVFYPGEVILNTIKILQPSLCERLIGKSTDQLLIRPLEIYEIPRVKSFKNMFGQSSKIESIFSGRNKINYLCKSTQKLKSAKSIDLISNILKLQPKHGSKNQLAIQLSNNEIKDKVTFSISEKLYLNNYIPAHLKYTNLESCLLIESKQFVDSYTVLGYFEAITLKSLEIVKLKSKSNNRKQIFLISNEDCLIIPKREAKNKTINNLLINNVNVNQTGKIIIDNGQFLTIQKGRPYFFPNCKNEDSIEKIDLQYKVVNLKSSTSVLSFDELKQMTASVSLNYYDITKRILTKQLWMPRFERKCEGVKLEFSKMFLKKNGKLYSSTVPIYVKKILITKKNLNLNDTKNWEFIVNPLTQKPKRCTKIILKNDFDRQKCVSMFLKSSELITNEVKKENLLNNALILVKFLNYPFNKSIGIHSITDDYFEQEMNSVYCKNGDFVENGQTIGLLNFEKEITGDIVQGLPRIEELLEARKKRPANKQVSINQKKSLLIQKTSIDPNFDFRKLGTPIKENEKINPHRLLKVYFNYYGIIKQLFCDKDSYVTHCRLMNNYEASYRSFKKVQALILNLVQSVYESQGVSIANKHLEVIIKQMTTKVLITHEGDTPLLPREVIDLYHMKYINDIVISHQKRPAYYVPFLLGITKAALNNPSFISAASFQETTRVLTKAAIEGRIDWLRGLKENIIIGHLIPAGTGSQNYVNNFKKSFSHFKNLNLELENLQKI